MKLLPFDIFGFARRSGRPLILDGAMGSLLKEKGVDFSNSLWSSDAVISHPDLVRKIHSDYISAGADIITSNTFRTNPAAVKGSPFESGNAALVRQALKISQDAAANLPVLIAGSNAPAEDCYSPQRTLDRESLFTNHSMHIKMLMENGAAFILNETQSHWDEIEIICSVCSSSDIPFVLSLYFTEELRLLSGETVFEAVEFIKRYKPLAISFNCISPASFSAFASDCSFDFNWGFYLNCGSGSVYDEHLSCGIDNRSYLEIIKKYLPLRPSFIGACCGSGPSHIKTIHNYFIKTG